MRSNNNNNNNNNNYNNNICNYLKIKNQCCFGKCRLLKRSHRYRFIDAK